jgi:hypothetical protein
MKSLSFNQMELIEGGGFLGTGTYEDGRGPVYDSPSCNGGPGYMSYTSFKILGVTIWDNEPRLVCLAGSNI